MFSMDLEGLKDAAMQIIDYMDETVEILQNRINQLNDINDYVKYDEKLMRKYGASIGERFGMVNVHTAKVDEITLHLNDVVEGKYDDYPSTSIGSLIFYWDKEVYTALLEVESIVVELESYMQYFQEVDVSDEEMVVEKKPTVH